MPYNSETDAYERRSSTIIDATPDGDTVLEAIDTKLDQCVEDSVSDINHHYTHGRHYPPTLTTDSSQFLKKSPAGVVSWENGIPIADGVESAILAESGGSALIGHTTGTVKDALDARPTSSTLAASGGSALVGFLQGGTGATARTVQSKLRDIVSVKDFGAVGDGTTDDTAAIALAVTAAAGKTLFFPAGTYLVSAATAVAAILLPESGIAVRGAGKYASTIKATSACVLMAAVDADRIDIADIGFDGCQSTALAWQRGVLLRGVVDATIKNCLFYRTGDSAVTFGKQGLGGSDGVADGTRQCERLFVQDNEIIDCFGTISIVTKYVGSKQTIVTGNIITNSSAGGISIESEGSLETELAEQIIVANNVIHKTNYSVPATTVTQAFGIGVTERASYVSVTGNIISDVVGDLGAKGIEVGTSPTQSDTPVSEIIVASNTVANVSAAAGRAVGVLVLVGDEGAANLSISNNIITDCTSSGIEFVTAFSDKTTGTIENCSVIGNVINDVAYGIFFNTLSSSGELPLVSIAITANAIKNTSVAGIYIYTTNSVINGNVLFLCGSQGIYTIAGSNRNVVSGNNIQFCADGMQLNGDSLLITDNICMNNTAHGIRVVSGATPVICWNTCGDDQTTKTQQHGIRSISGSTIRNNQLIGNVVSSVFGGIAAHNTGTYDAALNRTA